MKRSQPGATSARGTPSWRSWRSRSPTSNVMVERVHAEATRMVFDSLEAVRVFGGESYESAYVPPAARAVLSRFDEVSAHYEVLMTPADALSGRGSAVD